MLYLQDVAEFRIFGARDKRPRKRRKFLTNLGLSFINAAPIVTSLYFGTRALQNLARNRANATANKYRASYSGYARGRAGSSVNSAAEDVTTHLQKNYTPQEINQLMEYNEKLSKHVYSSQGRVDSAYTYQIYTELPLALKKKLFNDPVLTPVGNRRKAMSSLRKQYIKSSGLEEDMNKIRAAKSHARTGDLANQPEMGAKVIQRARKKAVNQGKTFRQIRQEMRDTLGFKSGLYLNNF